MPVRRGIVLGAACLLAGCVATAEVRDTSAEAAAGPPPPPPAQASAGQLVAPRHVTDDSAPDRQPDRIPPGKVWVKGDWHWDGVRYVWLPGHLEDAKPGYTWR